MNGFFASNNVYRFRLRKNDDIKCTLEFMVRIKLYVHDMGTLNYLTVEGSVSNLIIQTII